MIKIVAVESVPVWECWHHQTLFKKGEKKERKGKKEGGKKEEAFNL